MPIKRGHKEGRRQTREEKHRKRTALQPDGMPQGRHLTGFKGMKSEDPCYCGRCHPNAVKNHGRPKYITPKELRDHGRRI